MELTGYTITGKSEHLAFLDSLRAIAIIMVVGVHALGYSITLSQIQHDIILFVIHTVSVPLFFLVDGYIFARNETHSSNYTYKGYIKKSFFRLLVPWVIFTLIYTLARYVFELTGLLNDRLILGNSLPQIIISAYGAVYAPQMYFLFSLFLIRLCFPMLKIILSFKNYGLSFLFFLYYAVYVNTIPYISNYLKIDGGQEPILHALWGFQFYFAGVIIYKFSQNYDLKKLLPPLVMLLMFVLLIRYKFRLYNLDHLTQYLYLLSIFFFFAFYCTPGIPPLNLIGKNTMGIYLIHAPIILKMVSLFLNKFVYVPIYSFLSIWITALLLSCCIALVVNKVPYGCLLFGLKYQRSTVG
ncbi:MAG: acyltransferase [Thermodesulfobacteriota bacterium]